MVGEHASCERIEHGGPSISADEGFKTLVQSSTHAGGLAAVDFYFIQDDGAMFKATIPYEPYFYVTCRVSGLDIQETGSSCWLHLGWCRNNSGRMAREAVRGCAAPG